MSTDLVKVKLKDDFGRAKFVGLCGFFITKGETKMIAIEDFQAQHEALELVNPPVEQEEAIPEGMPVVDIHAEMEEPIAGKDEIPDDKELEEEFDMEKEAKDIVRETKDFVTKVHKHGRTKKSKK